MKGCYLLGERLGHSFSKTIHEAFGRYPYELKELPREDLGAFLKARDFAGLNVTIPYKEAVIPHLDRLDEAAAAIGAVNTVVNRDGLLWGYNTDFGGMAAALERAGIPLAGRTAFILGTGGTSKTALAVCRALGADRALRVSRSGREDALSYEALPEAAGDRPAVILNCTPAGMDPDLDGLALDPGTLPGLRGVYDCVYNPLRTRLVLAARDLDLPAEGGLYMLVKQAALACGRFTGLPVEEDRVEAVYAALRRDRENLVLIGMPGAGKTTVGRLLAQKTGKEFVDTDEEIVKRAGCSISDLFAARGEAQFRDLEAAVTADLARTGGKVIATGGGIVLRQENTRRLAQNGTLFWLNRPLADLVPTGDRPLGDTAEKLRALWGLRAPLYRAAADLILPVRGGPEETAEEVLNRWEQGL